MNTYQITPENTEQEKTIMNQIITNNGYHPQNTYCRHKNNPTNTTQQTKWATFTYQGPDTTIITKLFRNTKLRIAVKTTNTLKKNSVVLSPLANYTDRAITAGQRS
jgi:hypothetical protein